MITLSLKQRYQHAWLQSQRRELLFYNIMNILLPSECTILFTGVGSGTSEFLDKNYDNPLNAFDFVLFCNNRIHAYIDVTGYHDYSSGKGDSKPCIGMHKVWKAQDHGLDPNNIWFVHFVDTRVSMRWISLQQLMNHMDKTVKRYLYSDEKPYICLDQQYWKEPRDFLRWLKTKLLYNS